MLSELAYPRGQIIFQQGADPEKILTVLFNLRFYDHESYAFSKYGFKNSIGQQDAGVHPANRGSGSL